MELEISNIATLPTKYGKFNIQVFKNEYKEHLVVFSKKLAKKPVVRIHSECLTGDVFGSLKCDCGLQIKKALKFIKKNNGMIIYLRQEGRDIGLLNKVNAYNLQDKGYDTVEANKKLGFNEDERDYKIVDVIFKYFGIKEIELISNNPRKINGLKSVKVINTIPSITKCNKYNTNYLKVKKEKLNHKL